ncbi:MAG: CopG family transcriptional regulator [Sulfurimonas sp. RIFOXYD12_FULL_33_39]|nr:MAG: CopG family transcriptional regulator [Sulfurimonas sp. RIFCSPLOWO2_12_FULL_34_6]OHE09282.1 MAG: CopG family transcriptional regulator [Sulfurimonas sp. RIFOXYD12_FULL_33_39]OHE12935.1 MAG: CopG family transcriptional regulator [Sulfurimonas sp. RIFOXYD2_FULL_34_21]
MMKTVTMRVDDSIYDMIKLAAEGQKRNISNFIEFATLQYLTSSQFVENDEMAEIMNDKELVKNLMDGLNDFKNGDYTIV